MGLGFTGFPRARECKHRVVDGIWHDKSCITVVRGFKSVESGTAFN